VPVHIVHNELVLFLLHAGYVQQLPPEPQPATSGPEQGLDMAAWCRVGSAWGAPANLQFGGSGGCSVCSPGPPAPTPADCWLFLHLAATRLFHHPHYQAILKGHKGQFTPCCDNSPLAVTAHCQAAAPRHPRPCSPASPHCFLRSGGRGRRPAGLKIAPSCTLARLVPCTTAPWWLLPPTACSVRRGIIGTQSNP
jgi:hypothetical protein